MATAERSSPVSPLLKRPYIPAASNLRRAWVAASPADQQRFDPKDVFEAGLRNHHIANTAYPIAHQKTWGPYRLRGKEGLRQEVASAWEDIPALGLYAHIPFCATRCFFCEYTVVGKKELDFTRPYMDRLLREIDRYADLLDFKRRVALGFDIGGGTPTFVPASEIGRLVDKVRSHFRFAAGSDISIETTPAIAAADPAKIRELAALGIDRMSMGIQVTQPDLLLALNRGANTLDQQRQAVDNIRAAGFRRFNVDLMYGFANQTMASWEATLRQAIELAPDYITLYRMRYKLTRISDQANGVTLDQVRPMITLAKEILPAAGFVANPGKTTYSRVPDEVGTSSYLARRVIDGLPYLGFGLGSQSFSHTTIAYNAGSAGKNLKPYLDAVDAGDLPIQDHYTLGQRQVMGKMASISFYFGEINLQAFREKFGVTLDQAFGPEVEFVLREGLMEYTEHALSLTAKGALHINGVIPLFYAPSIQEILIQRDPHSADDMDRSRQVAVRVASMGEGS